MQSLKIIIFRDTDKPYTMIISSGVLIGIAFTLVALMSLFTFSVMSNVMFYGNGPQKPPMLAATTEQQQPDEGTEVQTDSEDTSTEDTTTEPQSDDPVADTTGEYAEEGTDDALTQNQAEEETSDEPVSTDDTTDTMVPPDVSITDSPPANTFSSITPYMPMESEVEAFLLQDATFGNTYIRVRAQIQKRLNLGARYRGRFCAALVDNNGNIGPSYPNQMSIEGIDVVNPERANTFRIGYRRNYDIQFDGIDPENYSAIVFYLFDEQTKTLQWRNSVPLTR